MDDAPRAEPSGGRRLALDDLLDDLARARRLPRPSMRPSTRRATRRSAALAPSGTRRHDASLSIGLNGRRRVYGLKKWLKAETWLFPPLFVAQVAAFAYAISFASAGPRSAVVLAPMAVLGLLFVPISFIATVNLSLGEQGLDIIHLSKDAFLGLLYWGVSICVPHGAFMMELFRISTDLSEHAKAYPSRAVVWTIVIVELVLFLYAAYRLDDRAAAFKVKRVEAPLVEVLEADVSAERDRAFSSDAALVLRGVRKVPAWASRTRRWPSNLSMRVELGEILDCWRERYVGY